MLLDRRRIKKWQKWIYGFMAILMVAFLVPVAYIGCNSGPAGQSSTNDRIANLEERLKASPGSTATMLSLAQAYQLAASEQPPDSQEQADAWGQAAAYYQQWLDATEDSSGQEAVTKRLETLQALAVVYSNLGDYEQAVRVYGQLTALQPDNSDFFLQMGSFAVQAGDTNTALLAFGKFLELAPDSPDADAIREWIEQNSGSPSPSPSPSS